MCMRIIDLGTGSNTFVGPIDILWYSPIHAHRLVVTTFVVYLPNTIMNWEHKCHKYKIIKVWVSNSSRDSHSVPKRIWYNNYHHRYLLDSVFGIWYITIVQILYTTTIYYSLSRALWLLKKQVLWRVPTTQSLNCI